MVVTPEQAAIVDHVREHRLTVAAAGAGSGKTHTTVTTVLDLVDRRRASLDELVLITFTNQAADELRERLEDALRRREKHAATPDDARFWQDQRERLTAAYVGTMHGFCSWILRTFGYDLGVAREPNQTISRWRLRDAVEDAVEQLLGGAAALFLSDAVGWHKHHLCDKVVEILDHLQDHGIATDDLLRQTEAQPELATDLGRAYRVGMAVLVAEAEGRYLRLKAEDHTLDSADLLARTAALLEGPDGSTIAARVCRRRQFLFIDEFQDTDRTQKRIVDALLPHLRRLLVVGDTKQSVYGFRAAEVSLLRHLAEEQGVEVLPLSISRRPTRRLLAVQNALFRHVSRRFPSLGEPLQPAETAPDGSDDFPPVLVVQVADLTGDGGRPRRIEATAKVLRWLLQRTIEDHGGARPVRPGDIAILARGNATLKDYAAGLESQGLAVRLDAGGEFYQAREIVDTYRVLQLLVHYPDDTALSVALDTLYLDDVDAASQEQHLLQYAVTEGRPLTDWFEDHYLDHARRLAELRKCLRTDTVSELLGRLYGLFRIRERLAQQRDSGAMANLEKLRDLSRELPGRQEQALTVRTFVDWLRQGILSERDEEEADVRAIDPEAATAVTSLLTIHRAKGLEFPFVIIPEIQRPLASDVHAPWFYVVPHWGLDLRVQVTQPNGLAFNTASNRFSQTEAANRRAQIEEEMRVFYVAVTRAQHGVVLIGKDPTAPPNAPGSEFYSWRDEIVLVRNKLVALGADYRRM
jgi:ATP-dependent exoDNAse (exonuclease V) beta subunit